MTRIPFEKRSWKRFRPFLQSPRFSQSFDWSTTNNLDDLHATQLPISHPAPGPRINSRHDALHRVEPSDWRGHGDLSAASGASRRVLNDYDASRYEGKSEFFIASLHLSGTTGTYVDSPRHRFRGGRRP